MRLFLEFVRSQGSVQQHRLAYAFRLFCAVYNHFPILDPRKALTADLWISYKPPAAIQAQEKTLYLSNLYLPRAPEVPAPRPTTVRIGTEETALFYVPRDGRAPDWLAEIFEWTSCADEYSTTARDSVGRIPFSSSVFARYSLDERRPYAAVAMFLLQRAIRKLIPDSSAKATPPAGITHAIVCSHDVDFIPSGRFSSLWRLVKNSLISLRESRELAAEIANRALSVAVGGDDPFENIDWLARQEQTSGITASFFFISRRRHRRDADYNIEHTNVVELMQRLQSMGMEIGVHGSYNSLDSESGLYEEFDSLRQFGFHGLLGGRQHWLRFTLDRLIPAVERAGARYDASVGWHDRVGFRAGACFPYPPYNFAEERPARFLEIPLAAMDQALSGQADAPAVIEHMLATSRAYGWGGISLLWHPAAFGGGQLPIAIGQTFFDLAEARGQSGDKWLSGADLLRVVQNRYANSGLLDQYSGTGQINVDEDTGSPKVAEKFGRTVQAALP